MTTPKEALEQLRGYLYPKAKYKDGANYFMENEESRLLAVIDQALASLQGEDAVEMVAHLPKILRAWAKTYRDNLEYRFPSDPDAEFFPVDLEAAARAILATGLVPDEAAISQSALWVISYTNYRGETSVRRIIPKSVRFGSTEWHPEPQWLLLAWDDDKQTDREFALKDFGSPEAAVRADEREKCAKVAESKQKSIRQFSVAADIAAAIRSNQAKP